jgi:hypothetical protein
MATSCSTIVPVAFSSSLPVHASLLPESLAIALDPPFFQALHCIQENNNGKNQYFLKNSSSPKSVQIATKAA